MCYDETRLDGWIWRNVILAYPLHMGKKGRSLSVNHTRSEL